MDRLFVNPRGKKFVKYSLPFFIAVVGSSFAFEKFQALRYELKAGQKMVAMDTELEKLGSETGQTEPVKQTDDQLYEDLMKKSDIENWHNIRVPRDGEDSKTIQDVQRSELIKKGLLKS